MSDLTPKEEAILNVLVMRRGRAISAYALIQAAWPLPPRADAATLRVHISNLRAKRPELAIGHAPGHGYILAL